MPDEVDNQLQLDTISFNATEWMESHGMLIN